MMDTKTVRNIARIVLALGRVHRVTLHEDGVTPESDTDHTVMLAVVVAELANGMLAGRIDAGKAVMFALAHDMVEAIAGDVVSIDMDERTRWQKAAREFAALNELERMFGRESWLVSTIREYEDQRCPEARVVNFVDKIMPKVTHTLNGAAAIRKLGIPKERLDDLNRTQLARLSSRSHDFPELARLFDELHDDVMKALSEPAIPGQLTLIPVPEPEPGAGTPDTGAAGS